MRSYSSVAPVRHADRLAGAALVLTLAIAWVHLALTGRWADVPGAVHGPRFPYYVTALALVSLALLASRLRPATVVPSSRAGLASAALGGGLILVATAFLVTFPPSTWSAVPFYDDWPGLLQLTMNGIDLLHHGAVVGWQWAFLGGYQTSADLSQSLALPAFLPVALFGANAGFHLLLAVVVALIPAAIYADLRLEGDRAAARLGAGLAAVTTAGYFATVMYSGMANSTAGAAFVALALAASNAARRGHRWGGVLLTLALTLTLYSHAAFYLYAAVILGVEVLFYRNWSGIGWLAIAFAASFVAALPVHWELLRYPAYYVTNNLYFDPPVGFDWAGLLRQIYYATEILLLPGRWFNDYVGLTHVWLPVIVWMAWRDRSRAGFYAWATLAIVLMLRFNAPQLGIISSRQMHLLPVVVAPAIAGFVDRHAPGGGWLRVALVLWIGLFVAVRFTPVPHLADVRSFDPTLVERLASRDGHLVLLENNPHWNMISTPGESTEESRFDVHYEALLPKRQASCSSGSRRTASIAAGSGASRWPAAGFVAAASPRYRPTRLLQSCVAGVFAGSTCGASARDGAWQRTRTSSSVGRADRGSSSSWSTPTRDRW
jgi:hypothetical protein